MPRQLTAAASRYSKKTTNSRASRTDSSSQHDAWRFFKEVPEVRFAGTWVGSAVSSATLYAGRRNADGRIERTSDPHTGPVTSNFTMHYFGACASSVIRQRSAQLIPARR